jgi:hypothetical protein
MRVVIVHTPLYPNMIPPLGTAQIAAYLEQKGCDVEVLWLTANDEDAKEIKLFQKREVGPIVGKLKQQTGKWVEEILSYKPDLVAISVYYNSLMTSILLGKELKSRSEVKIVVGGPETINPHTQDMLLTESFADYIVVREGEVSLGQIIAGNAKGKLLEHEAESLDALPLPVFKKAVLDSAMYKGILPYAFTRGCVGNCEFCTFRRVHGSFREMRLSKVRVELAELKETYGVDSFWFCDNILNYRKGVMRKLADTIADLNIYWGGYLRANEIITPDTCRRMQASGFRFARIGIESGSEDVLKEMCKPTDVKTMKQVIKNLHENNIHVRISIIVGHYSESSVDFMRTFEFLLDMHNSIDVFLPFNYYHNLDYNNGSSLLSDISIQNRSNMLSLFTKRGASVNDLLFMDNNYRNFKKKESGRLFVRDILLGEKLYAEISKEIQVITGALEAQALENSSATGFVRPNTDMSGMSFFNPGIKFTRPLPNCIKGNGPKSCAECLDILKITEKGIMRCSEKLIGKRNHVCETCTINQRCPPCYQCGTFEIL